MPKKKYRVTLTEAEREELQQMLRAGKYSTRKLTRARILLHCTDEQIVASLGVGRATVERLRESFVERGLEARHERSRPGKKRTLDAKAEARLIAEACSDAPAGRTQ